MASFHESFAKIKESVDALKTLEESKSVLATLEQYIQEKKDQEVQRLNEYKQKHFQITQQKINSSDEFKDYTFQMTNQLNEHLNQIRIKKNFNPTAWIASKIRKLNEYLARSRLSAVVVSVSGGIDSAVTFKLAELAAQQEGSPLKIIVAVSQPIRSTPSIANRALELSTEKYKVITIHQDDVYEIITNRTKSVLHDAGIIDINDQTLQGRYQFADSMVKSYMRTPINYYLAQLVKGLVLGTGNFDEDGYLYYFCTAGDGCVDVQLIADLHKSEVFRVGKSLGVAESILIAPPSADLYEGQTDEREIGVSYDAVELYTNLFAMGKLSVEEVDAIVSTLDELSYLSLFAMGKRIEQVHNENAFKALVPINL